jgi:hypothetical protein
LAAPLICCVEAAPGTDDAIAYLKSVTLISGKVRIVRIKHTASSEVLARDFDR